MSNVEAVYEVKVVEGKSRYNADLGFEGIIFRNGEEIDYAFAETRDAVIELSRQRVAVLRKGDAVQSAGSGETVTL